MDVLNAESGLVGPMPIEGESITLRRFEAADAAAIARMLADFTVVRFAGEIPFPFGQERAAQFIALSQRHFMLGGDSIFAATRARDGALIGCAALHAGRSRRFGRLGYWFGRAHWGRGYATEAVGLLLGYAFDTVALHCVQADAAVDNPASWRALARAGMSFEGIIDLPFAERGIILPARRYGMMRAEWRAMR